MINLNIRSRKKRSSLTLDPIKRMMSASFSNCLPHASIVLRKANMCGDSYFIQLISGFCDFNTSQSVCALL